MGAMAIKSNGELAVTGSDYTPEQEERIRQLERKIGLANKAKNSFNKEAKALELELQGDPRYQKKQRMKTKASIAAARARELQTILDHEYEEATRATRKGKRMVDVLDEALEMPVTTTRQRRIGK